MVARMKVGFIVVFGLKANAQNKEVEEEKETQYKEELSFYLVQSIHGHGDPIYIPPMGEAGLTEKEITCESKYRPSSFFNVSEIDILQGGDHQQ